MTFDSTTLNVFLIILIGVFFWIFIIWQNTRRMHKQIHQVAQQQSLIRHNDSTREFCRAVHLLQPTVHAGVDYVIREDGPDHTPHIAEWHAAAPQPTSEDIQKAMEKLSDGTLERVYAAMRKAEYPSVGDQLDASYQARHGDDAKQIEIDEKIRQVKEKYPKTDECL